MGPPGFTPFGIKVSLKIIAMKPKLILRNSFVGISLTDVNTERKQNREYLEGVTKGGCAGGFFTTAKLLIPPT